MLLAPGHNGEAFLVEETWRRSFALIMLIDIVAVKRCGRFIITGKSVLNFKSSGKVKSKWPIGERL